ncbi:MAG: hypothetical protein CSYNP_01076 [Syntrophus sp. SKADARSKE-3]|nr:hypothetical protein [Syntrophus sp. SKADARSKE-3]
MTEKDQDTLGFFLKTHREALLIPLQEIASALNSSKSLIEALEGNDYDAFKERSQTQALVKQYAAYLKINESEALHRFDIQWKEHTSRKGFPKLSSFEDNDSSKGMKAAPARAKSSKNWQLPKMPTMPSLPKIAKMPKIKFQWPILFVISLIGLFLLIDLPLSKQKAPPPEDPRFANVEKRPVQEISRPLPTPPPTPPIEEKASTIVQIEAPPQQGGVNRSHASQERKSSAGANGKIVGNSDTKRYHLPGMKFHDKIKAHHRVVFQSEKEALAAGYHKARE